MLFIRRRPTFFCNVIGESEGNRKLHRRITCNAFGLLAFGLLGWGGNKDPYLFHDLYLYGNLFRSRSNTHRKPSARDVTGVVQNDAGKRFRKHWFDSVILRRMVRRPIQPFLCRGLVGKRGSVSGKGAMGGRWLCKTTLRNLDLSRSFSRHSTPLGGVHPFPLRGLPRASFTCVALRSEDFNWRRD